MLELHRTKPRGVSSLLPAHESESRDEGFTGDESPREIGRKPAAQETGTRPPILFHYVPADNVARQTR
jgi:hypothetical protein